MWKALPSLALSLLSAICAQKLDQKAADLQPLQPHTKLYYFMSAGECIPKPGIGQTSSPCGEDAYMIALADGSDSGKSFLAVADGVGGWRDQGGDSSKVSAGLMSLVETLARESRSADISEIVERAFTSLKTKALVKGTTTVTSLAFDRLTGKLIVSNIGDSQVAVFRGFRLLHEVQPGIEAFNMPRQIGFDEKGTPLGSVRELETRTDLQLQPGDVVIAATDGLFDNLFIRDIEGMLGAMLEPLVALVLSKEFDPQKSTTAQLVKERLAAIVSTLCWYAHMRAKEQFWVSPFSEEAKKAGFNYEFGGKMDDITVVLSIVGNQVPLGVRRSVSKDEL